MNYYHNNKENIKLRVLKKDLLKDEKSKNIYYPNYRNNNMSNMEQQKRN